MSEEMSSEEITQQLLDALVAIDGMQARLDEVRDAAREPLAIVGMACRFPGGETPEQFWELLRDGRDAVIDVPRGRWDAQAYYDADRSVPGKMVSRRGAFVERIDEFDAEFFDLFPREAALFDPQQRMLMQTAWEALEDAGIPPDGLAGSKTGVFVGACTMDYALLQFRDHSQIAAGSSVGCSPSILANRLSYTLDLKGPSVTVDTACSSSLVALHQATASLRSGECELAIVGGVNAVLAPEFGLSFSKLGLLSPDGRCRTFDAQANGYVRGEGCGVVVLKRLSAAVANGDRIWAVLRGTAVNQDGRTNGITAPNGAAQVAVMRDALSRAGVNPAEVAYVEAHGIGTAIGDAIEVEAISEVYGARPAGTPSCFLGSVKPNIGHLEGAAGIAALIKTTLCLNQRTIPPVAHFTSLNPEITLDDRQLTIPTALVSWPSGPTPRLAAVSAFGFGGTNAHAILEEAPARPARDHAEIDGRLHVLALSARSPDALRALANLYRQRLSGADAPSLADACFTAAAGRTHHEYREVVIGGSRAEILAGLDALASDAGSAAAPLIGDRPGASEDLVLVETLAALYRQGRTVDWAPLARGGARLTRMPTYPWQTKRLWFGGDAPPALSRSTSRLPGSPPMRPRTTLSDPFSARPFQLKSTRSGLLDGLRLVDVAPQRPARGQVRIAVHAASLNFRDVLRALGAYPGGDPATTELGDECAGQVVDVGDGVENFAPGDEVIAIAPHCFGSHIVTSAALVWRAPMGWSAAEAASIPVVFGTAYHALHDLARVQPGERVLIHSATGGVGLAAIQIARWLGAEVFATAGTPTKRAFLETMGIQHVMGSRSLGFADEVIRRTDGEGVDVVLNSLTGEGLVRSLSLLRADGRFIEIGKRDIHANLSLGLEPFRRRLMFCHLDLGSMIRDRAGVVSSIVREVLRHIDAGTFRPLPTRVIPVRDASQAFAEMAQARHIGKLALSVDPASVDGLARSATMAPSPDLRAELLGLPMSERQVRMQQILIDNVARVLRIDPSTIDERMSLRDLGLDSLMTLELRTTLQQHLGVTLSVVKLAALPNLAKLFEYAIAKLEESTSGETTPVATPACAARQDAPSDPASMVRDEVLGLVPEMRVAWLESFLTDYLSRRLEVEPRTLDARTSLRDLGLDSLMTLELRTSLQQRLGIAVSVVKLAQLPNLRSIAEYAVAKLVPDSTELA